MSASTLVHTSATEAPEFPRYVTVDMAAEGFPRLGDRTFEVVTDRCLACGGPVDLERQATFALSRVGGDSANGYEPMHKGC